MGSFLKNRVDKLFLKSDILSKVNIVFNDYEFLVKEDDREQAYKPLSTAIKFHQSNNFVRLILGPYGCLSCDTEYLTKDGWKRFDEYCIGDEIAEVDFIEDRIKFNKSEYVKLECDYFLRLRNGGSIDQLLSEEHTIIYKSNINSIDQKETMWKTISAESLEFKHNKNKFSGYLPIIPNDRLIIDKCFVNGLIEYCQTSRMEKIDRIESEDGYKYCFNTSTGFFVARRNGKIFITGNSGKSTACCAEIIHRVCKMPLCYDGVRRARWAFVRNTYGDLEATTLKTWLEWFENLGLVHSRQSPRLIYTHKFNDERGPIELELVFIALDRPDHIRKLKSLELTGVYLNELSEIPQAALTHFKARVNRFPAKRDCSEPFWSGIIADSNPPPTDHWMYQIFEVDQPEGHSIFHQPPAVIKTVNGYEINPEAENLDHLMPKDGGYYLLMMQGQTEEFIKVYVQGMYGIVLDGKFVYPQYNDDIHSSDDVVINDKLKIILAWDYGTVSPACLLSQYDEDANRLYVVKEFVCEFMTVKELYEGYVEPYLIKNCRGMKIEIAMGDPADTYDGRKQLEECGLYVDVAPTNKVDARINSVSKFLTKLVMGKSSVLVSRKGCPKLREGFLGKYYYKRLRVIGEERYYDAPNKNHPFSDIHDCLQYTCLYLNYDERHGENSFIDYDDLYVAQDSKSIVTGY